MVEYNEKGEVMPMPKCPFCGGEAWYDTNGFGRYWIECKECHARTRDAVVASRGTFIAETLRDAEAYLLGAWERRADE